MTILEMALLSLAILVGGGFALFIYATWRSATQKNQDAERKFRDAEQKYRQSREARLSAEEALRRAEAEHRDAESKLCEAQLALQSTEEIRRQTQNEVRAANDTRAKVEHERDGAREERNAAIKERDAAKEEARQAKEDRGAAIRAKEQAERERDVAIAHAQLAEQTKIQAEEERDTARRERDEAIQARKVAEENTRRAIQAKFDAEEQARLAIQRAEELWKQAKDARDTALEERDASFEQTRLANERAQRAEELQKQATDAHNAAIKERDEAIRARQVAEEDAQRANERAQRGEELQKQAERERDAALERERHANERAEQAEKARDDAREHARLASERAEKAEREVAELRKASKPITGISPEPPQSPSEEETRTDEQISSTDDGARKSRERTTPVVDHKGARSSKPQFRTVYTPRSPKPEIVCVQKQNEWILRVELQQELLDEHSDLQVFQNELPLDGADGNWQLNDACGRVIVHSDKGNVLQIDLGERIEQPLLFKLSGDREQGHRVRTVTQGWYLLVVPEDWKHEGFEPQSVSIKGYHAYCRLVDDRREISFQTSSGRSIVVTPHVEQFALDGNRLKDADEKMGPLFGNTLPRIRGVNPNAWQQVEMIVVGEEGRERKEWESVDFAPNTHKAEQDLPPEIAQWRASWFFVRFKDSKGELIESTDFRLARGLNDIQIRQSSPFPTESGHSATLVEFHHSADCRIEPPSGLEAEYTDGKTTATICPSPESDRTVWNIATIGHDPVQVTILVERIWWALGTVGKMPSDSEWIDKPLSLTPADFTAVSEKVLRIRLPRPRWADEIQVGFAQETARPFPVKVTEQTASIPLCRFCDSASLNQIGLSRFVIRVDDCDATLAEVRVQAKCRHCDFVTVSPYETVQHIESSHLRDFFSQLTYDELRERIRHLPPRMLKCRYCSFYAASDEYGNPTDKMWRHLKACPHAPRIGGIGPREKGIVPITDPDEIRENVIKNLPTIFRCKICDTELENPTWSLQREHLTREHSNDLFEIR